MSNVDRKVIVMFGTAKAEMDIGGVMQWLVESGDGGDREVKRRLGRRTFASIFETLARALPPRM